MYDTIIIGGGPAGISAALYAASKELRLLLLEKGAIGGMIGTVSHVSHYVGALPVETGAHFAERLQEQLSESGCPHKREEVTSLEKTDHFIVKTDASAYEAKSVIVACGSERKQLPIAGSEGFRRFARDVKEPHDNIAVIFGGSDGACKEALYLSPLMKTVHIVEVRDGIFCVDAFRKQIEAAPNILFHKNTETLAAEGSPIHRIILQEKTTKAPLVIEGNDLYCYSYIGQEAHLEFLRIPVRQADGYADEGIVSETKGLFFAGDVRHKAVKQVASAVYDGCEAANGAYAYVQSLS